MHRLAPAVTAVALLTATACGGATDEPSANDRPTPTTPAATAQPVPSPTAEASDVDALVDDFLASIGRDSERAWELLTTRSQQTWGSYEAFEGSATEFAEGLAAFAGLQDRERLDVGDDLVVVVVRGEVTREGMTEYDGAPLPVRTGNGPARVEIMGPETVGAVEVESPMRGAETVQLDTELSAYAPAGSDASLWLDGAEVDAEQTAADGDRIQLTASPELAAGQHVLTVTAVRADGLLLAQSVAFQVS
jgi:hypothetical protein